MRAAKESETSAHYTHFPELSARVAAAHANQIEMPRRLTAMKAVESDVCGRKVSAGARARVGRRGLSDAPPAARSPPSAA